MRALWVWFVVSSLRWLISGLCSLPGLASACVDCAGRCLGLASACAASTGWCLGLVAGCAASAEGCFGGAPARRPGRSPITRVQRSACVCRGRQRRHNGPLDACGCLRQAAGQERPRLLSTHTEEFKHPAGRTHTLDSCLEVCLPARDPLVPCSHPSYDPVCRTLRFSARNKMSLAGSRPRSRSGWPVSFVSTAPAPGVCPSMRGRSCPTTCPEGTTDCQEVRWACTDARKKRRRTS
ncbi:hypothetical protein H4W33_005994 [Kibdelosporangium phytohabitans]|nr:hypothetical protein [Kibdelosporangium phytohabitans]